MTIDADDVEAITRRIAQLVGHSSRLVDAQSVAAALDVEREVHAHARELGVVRLGPGPNALMRFDLAVVRERIAALVQAIRGYPDHRHDASVADSNQEEVYIPIEGSATLRAPDGYLDPHQRIWADLTTSVGD